MGGGRFWLPIVLQIASCAMGSAETRRALLVGINEYLPADPNAAAKPWAPTSLRPVPVFGKASRFQLNALEGAVNDAEQMADVLEQRFGFRKENIKILRNGEATADNILRTLDSFLIQPAQPGDVSLFFYAGHGSRMLNKKSDAPSQMDSTILPADAGRGVPDIRGKELARIYLKAVERKVHLTVIQDSCYSGSGARGALYTKLRVRAEPPDSRYVEDAWQSPYPEDLGVLVLSASQDYQTAAELEETDLKGAHGLFTWALLKVLWSVAPDERVDTIFQRARSLVQSELPSQEPVMAGKGRADKGLWGQPASSLRARPIPVRQVSDDGTILLGAGLAMGLRPGAELKRYSKQDAPPEIKVAKVTGLNASEAVSKGALPKVGDVFQLDRWVSPDDHVLRVYYPRQTLARAAIGAVVRDLEPLRTMAGVRWIDDPTEAPADFVLSWNGAEWVLTPGTKLGARPTAAAVAKAMHNQGSLFVLLPPPREMLDSLRNDAIQVTVAREKAVYVLLGRAGKNETLEYAWALPNARVGETKMPLPLRTFWVTTGGELLDLSLRLARLRGWLQLQPPATPVEFPYHLALENAATKQTKKEGETRGGEKYRVVLTADPKDLDDVPRRWVYAFIIESSGEGKLLYPPEGRGSVNNLLPVLKQGAEKVDSVIPLTPELEIIPPFGVDTYYLLVSEDPIPDPTVLNFNGVRAAGRGAGTEGSPLSRLLTRVGTGSRGEAQPVPVNWSIERHLFISRIP